ncbi:MAG: twin-arginine translocation signal domain-containing protein [Halobacteriota archaeon]
MNRRTFLIGATGLGGTALAGCLGREEDRFTLSVADYNFDENDDGYLEAWATVSNVANEPQEGTLYFTGQLEDDTIVRVRDVALEAHRTREYTVTYDVLWDDVRNFSLDVEIEPPDS